MPDSWTWCRFSTATINRDGERIPLSQKTREKLEKKYDYYGASGVIDKVDKYLFNERLLLIGEDGANLITRSKPIAFIANGLYWVNNHAHVLQAPTAVLLDYLCCFINAIPLDKYVTGSAQPKMTQDKMNTILIHLPPLAEQQRIVEQIETLLGYVDIIDTDAETLEKSITLAKRKILDLAIRGKLVPQDSADEPASELLKKIKAEKDALVKAGKIKKDKHESYIFKGDDNCYHENIDGKVTNITDEIPFDLPDSWTWSRIENIGVLNPRNKIEDDTEVSFMPMAQLEAGFGSKYTLSEKKWKEVKSGFTHFAENDIVFAKITPCFQNRKSAVMRGLKNGYGAGTTELHVLRSNSYLIVPEYALLFVKTQSFITDAVATIQGVVGQQRIDAGFVKHYLFPIPPLAEQKRIVSQVEKLFSVLETMRG